MRIANTYIRGKLVLQRLDLGQVWIGTTRLSYGDGHFGVIMSHNRAIAFSCNNPIHRDDVFEMK